MGTMGKESDTKRQLKTEIREVNPKDLVLLKKNARYMPAEKFNLLVKNIKKDNCLSSTPLCYEENGRYTVLSGNHRTMASIEAGLKKIQIMVILNKLSKDELRAIQLSHNSLNGLDNTQILKEIWEEIRNLEDLDYTGISKEDLEKYETPTVTPIDAQMDFEQITLLFLGNETDKVKEIAERCRQKAILSDNNLLETIESYEAVREATQAVCSKEKIHNYATAFATMAEYALKYMEMEKKRAEKCG